MTPRHVAIIMDGNRRWAAQRGVPIACGYRRGIVALRQTLRAAAAAGVGVVTAYAFSEENWERPPVEVGILMRIAERAARGELRRLAEEGVRIRLCGRSERLPRSTRNALERLVSESARNDGIVLNLAIDYGGRREIGDAVRALAEEVRTGVRDAATIDERALASRLYTAGLPDPDLILRTGGELRLSNFLLFQSAYAEFWATPTYWPDFTAAHFQAALDDFASRQRRYGT
ncbi:MAG TPA: polyprenyl diphosphate synthase [Candidatus Nitrosotalea sp.]|nr:polyprenyl diphosphate synthase [Candidatus Nitrosotalea sp.]